MAISEHNLNIYDDIESLLKQIPDTEENKNKLITVRAKINSIKKYEEANNFLKEKTIMAFSLLSFIKNICKSEPKIYGSFVRQMMEKMFMSDYDDTGYGDSDNHDIDMVIYFSKNEYERYMNKKSFENLLDIFKKMINNKKYKFNGYTIISISNSTITNDNGTINCNCGSIYCRYHHKTTINQNIKKLINIPHYHLILNNGIKTILIDMFAYSVINGDIYNIDGDINVNRLELNNNGIISRDNCFYQTIYSIIKREGICNVLFTNLIEDIKTKILTFEDKQQYYNYIILFYVSRIKLLSNGYNKLCNNIHEKVCKISIENEDPCEISGREPPYIKFDLVCGHKLSIMALTGIANIKSSNYYEGILCPYCREKLVPALEFNRATYIDYPDILNIKDSDNFNDLDDSETPTTPVKLEKIKNNIISKENFDYIYNLLGITKEEEDDNEEIIEVQEVQVQEEEEDDNEEIIQVQEVNQVPEPIPESLSLPVAIIESVINETFLNNEQVLNSQSEIQEINEGTNLGIFNIAELIVNSFNELNMANETAQLQQVILESIMENF